jgi:hypothetical protein
MPDAQPSSSEVHGKEDSSYQNTNIAHTVEGSFAPGATVADTALDMDLYDPDDSDAQDSSSDEDLNLSEQSDGASDIEEHDISDMATFPDSDSKDMFDLHT